MAGGFGPDARLRTRGEFVAVEDGGRRVSGRYLILVGKPNGRAGDRLGIIASRRVGGAVDRHPPQPRVGDQFGRREPRVWPRAQDVVAVSRPQLFGAPVALVQTDFVAALTKLRGPR